MKIQNIPREKWIYLINKIVNRERAELISFTRANKLMQNAFNEAHTRLIKISGASAELLTNIYKYTICVQSLINSNDIYNAYLPLLLREINNNKINN